jgi:hypothetical protein
MLSNINIDSILQPNGVPPEVAAVASDAGVTTYHAVQQAAQVKTSFFTDEIYNQLKYILFIPGETR